LWKPFDEWICSSLLAVERAALDPATPDDAFESDENRKAFLTRQLIALTLSTQWKLNSCAGLLLYFWIALGSVLSFFTLELVRCSMIIVSL